MSSSKAEQKQVGSRTSAPIFKATFLRKTSKQQQQQQQQQDISTTQYGGGQEREVSWDNDGDGKRAYEQGGRGRDDGGAYANGQRSTSPAAPSRPSPNSRNWPPTFTEAEQRRRDSQVSTASFSPLSRESSLPHPNRISLSSFASPPGSVTSNGTTIGNLSTSSMPLLAGIRDESRRPSLATDGGNSFAPSSLSRRHADSSTTSVSDSSSVHSYPPTPRNDVARQMSDSSARSKRGTRDGPLESWKSWGKDVEDTGGGRDKLGQEQGDGVLSTQLDPWHYLSYSNNRATPLSPARQSLPPSYNTGTSSPRTPSSSAPCSSLNPLGPFRRRLARSIGAGKRVRVELQLVVELIDALENYIAASSPSSSGDDLGNGATASLEEVTLLVNELIEVAPDAQRCLTDGLYGPFAYPSAQLKPHLKTWNDDSPSWWPRRLARECRCVLEEMGLLMGTTPMPSSRTPVSVPPNLDVAEESLEETEEAAEENGDPHESATVVARKAELMDQGRKRWEEWRRKQSLEHDF